MAKGNNSPRYQNNQKKRSSSYFKRQIDNGGTDFLKRMNVYQMNKDYINILRDLCTGFFDPVKDGIYLTNNELLSSMIDMSAQEAYYYDAGAIALNYYINVITSTYGTASIDPRMVSALNRNMRYAMIHKTVNFYLYQIQMSGDYIGWTQVMLQQLESICKVGGPPINNVIDPQQFYNQ